MEGVGEVFEANMWQAVDRSNERRCSFPFLFSISVCSLRL